MEQNVQQVYAQSTLVNWVRSVRSVVKDINQGIECSDEYRHMHPEVINKVKLNVLTQFAPDLKTKLDACSTDGFINPNQKELALHFLKWCDPKQITSLTKHISAVDSWLLVNVELQYMEDKPAEPLLTECDVMSRLNYNKLLRNTYTPQTITYDKIKVQVEPFSWLQETNNVTPKDRSYKGQLFQALNNNENNNENNNAYKAPCQIAPSFDTSTPDALHPTTIPSKHITSSNSSQTSTSTQQSLESANSIIITTIVKKINDALDPETKTCNPILQIILPNHLQKIVAMLEETCNYTYDNDKRALRLKSSSTSLNIDNKNNMAIESITEYVEQALTNNGPTRCLRFFSTRAPETTELYKSLDLTLS
jgi:hypothetical protein